MGQYSIKELEKLSGIKAHTIRIWEKRYNLVRPSRTETNIRLYSDLDLKKIINVSLLKTSGYKISKIASMSESEVSQKVNHLSEQKDEHGIQVDKLITAMLDMNEILYEQELNRLERKFGFEHTLLKVVYPFLKKIGILWQTGAITPSHEHFITHLIRQKIIVATANLPFPEKSTLRAVLFLPENELHEIGLLFYNYLARYLNIKTFYLGQSVPHADLIQIYHTFKPHYLITSLTSTPAPQELNNYLQQLAIDFPLSKILASGALLQKTWYSCPQNLVVFDNPEMLKTLLLH